MNPSDDLTVGEVLSLLQEDYPEATLGRLREFEDLSLITPELGTSGHRRYPAATLDRLRWVLDKMRDGFDPADLVDESGQPTTPQPESDPRPSGSAAVVRKKSGGEPPAEPTLFEADQTRVQPLPKLASKKAARKSPTPVSEDTAAHSVVQAPAKPPAASPRRQPEPPPQPKPAPKPKTKTKAAVAPEPEPESAKPVDPPAPPTRAEHRERRARIEAVSALQEPPPTDPVPRPRPSRTRDLPSATEATELLARPDFLAEVGLDEETLGDMERFAVISPVTIGGTSSYDQSAVLIGNIVAELLELGYEARHLRMFRMAAEREVDQIGRASCRERV